MNNPFKHIRKALGHHIATKGNKPIRPTDIVQIITKAEEAYLKEEEENDLNDLIGLGPDH